MNSSYKLSIIFILFSCQEATINSYNSNGEQNPIDTTPTSSSLKLQDLTGTWKKVEEQKYYSIEGAYTYSVFKEGLIFLEDTDEHIFYQRCEYLGYDKNHFGFKTDDGIKNSPYDVTNTVYSLLNDGSFLRIDEAEVYHYEQAYNVVKQHTLTKLSNEHISHSGKLIIDGPLSIQEHTHVCAFRYHTTKSDFESIYIYAPFDSSYISIEFKIYKEFTPGIYYYQDTDNLTIETPFSIEIFSPTSKFTEIALSNTISPKEVTTSIFEASEGIISGSSQFVDNFNKSYTIEFNIDMNELQE